MCKVIRPTSSTDPSHITSQWSKRPCNTRARSGENGKAIFIPLFSLSKGLEDEDSTNSGAQILGFKYHLHHLLFGDVMTPRVANTYPFYSPFPGASY